MLFAGLLLQLLHSLRQWLVSQVCIVHHEEVKDHVALLSPNIVLPQPLHIHIVPLRPAQ